MTRKVDPFVPAKLFNDPRNTGFLPPSIRVNVARPSNRCGKEFALANGLGLTDVNENLPLVVEPDGSRRLARMRAVRVGV